MKRDLAALIAFIDARQNTPYEWGRDRNDCVAFVFGAVEAQTGIRPARKFDWKTEKKALRLIVELGGLEAVFDRFFERIPPAQAMRGDIAGVPDEALGIHPMIVEGRTLVAPGPKGNKRGPRSMMMVAWSSVDLKA